MFEWPKRTVRSLKCSPLPLPTNALDLPLGWQGYVCRARHRSRSAHLPQSRAGPPMRAPAS
eukprot:212826-Prymnesium_polylepis.1